MSSMTSMSRYALRQHQSTPTYNLIPRRTILASIGVCSQSQVKAASNSSPTPSISSLGMIITTVSFLVLYCITTTPSWIFARSPFLFARQPEWVNRREQVSKRELYIDSVVLTSGRGLIYH
ncbi:uncharacterized protein K489DRAFT_146005 [Dissoconium aciculare CBS 342.82]|uniref:Uncharacterized protein n=1 Tax=Dissoconium aciculare CBS 342.82 TaxID=1314786 RepID=A0A6J3MAT4_9PEZI|nr:uncharacterized protein K489DRAFT_146005 [Dissoconium aciculare CBS 342.82]KAF1824973.1 hypothetical protein K489DRAFT_146005 [Dissoconium aciculare CBS 342.82]